jgi:alpha-glucosidase
MKHSLILFLYCFSFCLANAQTGVIDASRVELKSPDKNITLHFYQKQITDGTRMMFYDVTYKDKPVISESQFDIQLDNHLSEQAMAIPVDLHKDWCENLKMTGIDTSSSNIRWTPVCGEQKEIQDHFKAAAIHFVKDNNAIYKMDVELRVYNAGVAIRYFFRKMKEALTIM